MSSSEATAQQQGLRRFRSSLDLPPVGHYGRFELLGRLAYGGMAEIFLARERPEADAARHLVVKRILPHVADEEQFIGMFRDEARLAMRLNHPNICHIYEFGQAEGTHFIAMEWVDGVSLKKLIRRARSEQGMPVAIAARIVADVAGALNYAHRARDEEGRSLGIVHRDVSPPNIMVSFDGTAKLLDFGVAKARTQLTKTQTGAVKGKFAYMSPEQCLGKEVDARADVFALGVCLYEALTGMSLYKRQSEWETMRAIVMEQERPSVRAVRSEVPEELDTVVRRALAREPEARFQSAAEMRRAIQEVLVDRRELADDTHVADYLTSLFHEELERGPLIDSSLGTSLQSGASGPRSHVLTQSDEGYLESTAAAPERQLLAVDADAEAEAFARVRRRKSVVLAILVTLVLAATGVVLARSLLAGSDADRPPSTEASQGDEAGERAEPQSGGATDGASSRAGEAERSPRFEIDPPAAE